MNVSKTPQGSLITTSGPPLDAVMLGMPPNAITPPMGQPSKPPTPSDISSAKRNQVNFVKKPTNSKKIIFLPKTCVLCHLNRKFDKKGL
jgi:hypothetical protein